MIRLNANIYNGVHFVDNRKIPYSVYLFSGFGPINLEKLARRSMDYHRGESRMEVCTRALLRDFSVFASDEKELAIYNEGEEALLQHGSWTRLEEECSPVLMLNSQGMHKTGAPTQTLIPQHIDEIMKWGRKFHDEMN